MRSGYNSSDRDDINDRTGEKSGTKGHSSNEKTGFSSAMFAPVLLLAVFAMILASRYMSDESLGLKDNPYFAVVVIQLITYALPSLFYVRLRGRDFSDRVRLRAFSPGRLLYIFHTTVFMLCGVVLLSTFMYMAFPESFAGTAAFENAAFAMNNRVFDGLYLIIAFACLPAFTEEYLFRGIVTAEYESYGVGVAVIMSALTFAMSHFSLPRFPVYFFSGIIMALAAYATRSVLASMIVHAVNNAFVLFGEQYILKIADKQNASFVLFIIIVGGAAVISGMLMCYEAYGIYRTYSEENYPSDYAKPREKMSAFYRIAQSFFTPTFLLLVIVFVVASLT